MLNCWTSAYGAARGCDDRAPTAAPYMNIMSVVIVIEEANQLNHKRTYKMANYTFKSVISQYGINHVFKTVRQ